MPDFPTEHSHPASGPASSPLFSIPGPVMLMAALLVAMHVVPPLFYADWEARSLYFLSFIPARLTGGTPFPHMAGSEYWTMITYALVHQDLVHLSFNCLWLVVFGTPVALALGPLRFWIFAILTAIAGALASLYVHWGEPVPMIGASASVSGMIGAAIPIMFARGGIQNLRSRAAPEWFSIQPIGQLLAHRRAMIFLATSLFFSTFTGATKLMMPAALIGEQQIAWEAHLGGFLAGFALVYLFVRKRA